jgi:hypothetical protein
MDTIEMKSVGFALYDVPTGLRKFLEARASGNASKEMMAQLSEAAMAEMEEKRSRMPKATVLDFASARRERAEQK